MNSLLTLSEVTLQYGSLRAVDAVSLTIEKGERRGLIGPNGAGKSSLLGLIAGTIRRTSGQVTFEGADISGLDEYQRARLGLVKTFQHSSVFLGMTVLENVALAAQRSMNRAHKPWWGSLRPRAILDPALEHLSTVGLADRTSDLASSLSHGERRQLEVAISLAVEPRLLLLDEPTAGMSSAESRAFVDMIHTLPGDVTVLLVEHDLDVVFELVDQMSVMHLGSLIASGGVDEVRASQAVQDAYLGGAHSEPLFEEV